MKKLLRMKFMLLLCALFAGSGSVWADDYELYSGTITEGDYVIVYDGVAMKNTVSDGRLGYESVTISEYKISTPSTNLVWHIAASGNYWTIYNVTADKYAAGTGVKNKAQLLDDGTDDMSLWTVSGTSTYEFVNKKNDANSVNKNLRYNSGYGFACYATSTGGALSLYKKVEAAGAATTVTIDATGITNTNKFNGTAAGTFTASVTVTSGGTTVDDATVTWSSSDASVATIGETTGTVTLVGEGSTTITASYAGKTGEYKSSYAEYELTVTDEDPNAVTLWSENFSSYSADDVPSGGTYSYVCADNGTNITKIYDATMAGGSSPELLVGKNGGSFSATIPLEDIEGSLKLKFKSNAYAVTVSTSTDGVNIIGDASFNAAGEHTVTFTGVTSGMTSVKIKFAAGSSNVRIDDIELKGSQVAAAAVKKPVITIADNPFLFSTTATITCATEGASIKYSFDGETWNDYTEALTITETKTIYAKAIKGNDESSVAQVTATKNLAEPIVTIDATGVTNTNVYTGTVAGSLSATVKYNDNAIDGATVTWSGNNDEVATINASTGAVTLVAAGSVTFTATYAGNDDYSEKSATYVMTVTNDDPNAPGSEANPYTVAQARAAIDAGTGITGVYATGIVSEIVTPLNTSYGNITYNMSADGKTTSDQLQAYRGKGKNGNSFTSKDDIQVGDVVVVYGNLKKYNDTYEFDKDNELVSLVREQKDAVIVVEDSEVEYGSTFTVDATMIEGGAITVTSSNTAVATVNGLIITPVAVGTTTITVATAENVSYKAGSETFTLTVKAPAALATAPSGDITTTFKNKDLEYDGVGIDWTASKEATSFESASPSRGVQFGSVIGDFTLTASNTDEITKVSMVVSTNGTADANTISVKVGDTDFLSNNEKTFKLPKDNNQTVEFIGEGTGDVVISVKDDSKSVYFKSITLIKRVGFKTILNASGFATYCSQYPLDFTNAEGYTAWQITDISSDNVVTFSQIKGKIKGGQGILLKGAANAEVTLASADSETELSDNLLEGTLAPTYIANEEYYGLSGDTFVRVSAGVVPAGKALLDADWITVPTSGARPITFVFEDGGTTSIRSIDNGQLTMDKEVYDLQGRKVANPTKGLYIVNGKKAVIK